MNDLTTTENSALAWLLRQASPAEADAALLRSLTSTLHVTAKARVETRFPDGQPPYQVVVGYAFDVADHGTIPSAIAKIEQSLTPATADQCEAWLVMLQAATARRADSEATAVVAYGLYAAELRSWPADVAKAACLRLARGKPGSTEPNWFPTLAELVAECERLAAPRKALLSSLQRWASEPEVKVQTPEERAAIHRMANETAAKIRAEADARSPRPKVQPIPPAPETSDVSPQMRDLIARRASQ